MHRMHNNYKLIKYLIAFENTLKISITKLMCKVFSNIFPQAIYRHLRAFYSEGSKALVVPGTKEKETVQSNKWTEKCASVYL